MKIDLNQNTDRINLDLREMMAAYDEKKLIARQVHDLELQKKKESPEYQMYPDFDWIGYEKWCKQGNDPRTFNLIKGHL